MKRGILATGMIARKFATTINQLSSEGEALAAVGSRSIDSARAFADEFSIPTCYDSYEQLAAERPL